MPWGATSRTRFGPTRRRIREGIHGPRIGALVGDDSNPTVGPPVARAVGECEVADDRSFGWAEYGHPDGDVILWFHGTPGSRYQIPPLIDEVALQRGFRVIGVDRPGTGRSTNHSYRRVSEYGPDIEALADGLGIDRFAAVGLSGGGPYTLSVARHMPDRVVVASILGGVGPTRGPDAVFSWTRALRFVAPAFEVLRSPAGTAISAVVRSAAPVADPVFRAYAGILGMADRPVLNDPEFKAMFIHDLLAAENLRSVGHDLALFARHWGFGLEEVTTPVVVWQGLNDTIIPPSHGHHQAARLPKGELRVRFGEGHFAGFADSAAVLDRIREVWAQETVHVDVDGI